MSQSITGDLAVSGNGTFGGSVTTQSGMSVMGNLRVGGWLFAANVRDMSKGIFRTLAALQATYPEPQDGWIAGVGASAPFATYLAESGEWVATGGSFTPDGGVIDVESIYNAINLRALKSEMSVTNGSGANVDKIIIQLKSGLTATALRSHQNISHLAPKNTVYTKEESIGLLGRTIGEAVTATYVGLPVQKNMLCHDESLLLMSIDGVGYTKAEVEESGDIKAKFIFADESKVSDGAFMDVRELSSIHLPSWIKGVGAKAFSECLNLATVECESMTPPSVENDSFENLDPANMTLKVHEICKTYYLNHPFWGTFGTIVNI